MTYKWGMYMSYNARYQDIDDYDEYNEYEDDYEEEKSSTTLSILGTIAKWFIRIGILCAVIVGIYYLVKLQIVNLLLFIIGLIIAYFFGYFFMFCLDKLTSNK